MLSYPCYQVNLQQMHDKICTVMASFRQNQDDSFVELSSSYVSSVVDPMLVEAEMPTPDDAFVFSYSYGGNDGIHFPRCLYLLPLDHLI